MADLFPDIRDTIRALEAAAPGAEADGVADRLIAKLHAAAATIRATKADKAPIGIMAMEQYLALVTAHMRAHDCDQASAEQAVRATADGLKLWNSWGDRQHNADVLAEDRTHAPQATAKTDTNTTEEGTDMSKRMSRAAALAAIEQGGAQLRKAEPGLSAAQAIAKFIKMDEARDLLAAYAAPDGHLSDADHAAVVRKRTELRKIAGTPDAHGTWSDTVAAIASDVAKARGIPFPDALRQLLAERPALAEAVERERAGR